MVKSGISWGGVRSPIHVKAVYRQGNGLSRGGSNYIGVGLPVHVLKGTPTTNSGTYETTIRFTRCNTKGYGTPMSQNVLLQLGIAIDEVGMFFVPIMPERENEDLIFTITSSKKFTALSYKLVEVKENQSITGGSARSAVNVFGAFYMTTPSHDGIIDIATISAIIKFAATGKKNSIALQHMKDARLKKANGEDYVALEMSKVRNLLADFVNRAMGDSVEISNITYYQLQWALLNEGEYLPPDEAYNACQIYSWCQPTE